MAEVGGRQLVALAVQAGAAADYFHTGRFKLTTR